MNDLEPPNPEQDPVSHKDVCLRELVENALEDYFSHLNGEMPNDLHQLVTAQVERPLLAKTLDYAGGNQTKAAKMLGISRATLRKKLAAHGL